MLDSAEFGRRGVCQKVKRYNHQLFRTRNLQLPCYNLERGAQLKFYLAAPLTFKTNKILLERLICAIWSIDSPLAVKIGLNYLIGPPKEARGNLKLPF